MKKSIIAAMAALAITLFCGCEKNECITPITDTGTATTIALPGHDGKMSWHAARKIMYFNVGDSVLVGDAVYPVSVPHDYSATAAVPVSRGTCYYPATNVYSRGGRVYASIPRTQHTQPAAWHTSTPTTYACTLIQGQVCTMLPRMITATLSILVTGQWLNSIDSTATVVTIDSIGINHNRPLWGELDMSCVKPNPEDNGGNHTLIIVPSDNTATPDTRDMDAGVFVHPYGLDLSGCCAVIHYHTGNVAGEAHVAICGRVSGVYYGEYYVTL